MESASKADHKSWVDCHCVKSAAPKYEIIQTEPEDDDCGETREYDGAHDMISYPCRVFPNDTNALEGCKRRPRGVQSNSVDHKDFDHAVVAGWKFLHSLEEDAEAVIDESQGNVQTDHCARHETKSIVYHFAGPQHDPTKREAIGKQIEDEEEWSKDLRRMTPTEQN